MKRQIKRTTGIYQYLDSCGVLESGTDDDIAKARNKYWKEYKKRWKAEKQKTSKPVEIVFNHNEFKFVTSQAKKHFTNPTNYIKQSALAAKGGIIDPTEMGKIRELLILYRTSLQILADENMLSLQLGSELLEQISQIEMKIFKFFSALKL